MAGVSDYDVTPKQQNYNYGQECDECGSDLSVKAKLAKMGKHKRSCSAFVEICDPVADEVKDLKKLNLAYRKYPIIPFFDEGDAHLEFFRKTKDLSPTHGGAIQSICDYVLGGEFTVTRKKREGFRIKDNKPLSETEHDEFIDFVENLNPDMTGASLLEVAKGLYENYKTYGNAFLLVELIEVAGTKFVYIKSIDCEKVRYHARENTDTKTVLISPIWLSEFVDSTPPDFINVYPSFSEMDNGVTRTIIHIKNKVVGRDWYGQPDSMPSLYYQYMEIQLGQFSTEGYANDFIPSVFMEISSDAEDQDDEGDFEQALIDTFTNRAKTKKKVLMRRKLCADPATTVHEFKKNTDHEFHSSQAELAEKQIIKSHNWHKLLMGITTAGKLGQGNEFDSVFKNKFKNVIRPLQKKIANPLNIALKIADAFKGSNFTDTRSLDFANLYEEIFETENEDGKSNETKVAEVEQQLSE